jgi:hypothetical protein
MEDSIPDVSHSLRKYYVIADVPNWLVQIRADIISIVAKRDNNGRRVLDAYDQKKMSDELRAAVAPVLNKYFDRGFRDDKVRHWQLQKRVYHNIIYAMKDYTRYVHEVKGPGRDGHVVLKRNTEPDSSTSLWVVCDGTFSRNVSHLHADIDTLMELRRTLGWCTTYLFVNKAYYDPRRKNTTSHAYFNTHGNLKKCMSLIEPSAYGGS